MLQIKSSLKKRGLAALEFWIVACAIAISIAYPKFLPFATLIGAFFWLLRWISPVGKSVRTPIDGAVLLLGATIIISSLLNVLTSESTIQVFRLLTGVLLFYAIVNWVRDRSDIRWLTIGTLAIACLVSVYALLGLLLSASRIGDYLPGNLQPYVAGFVEIINPNVLAGSLVVVFPLPIALFLFWRDHQVRGIRLFATVSALVISALLIFTQSRGAWIAMFIAAAALVWMRWKWGWIVVLAVMLVGGMMNLALDQALVFGQQDHLDLFAGFENRSEIWWRALQIGKSFAFSGVGVGNFGRVADSLYPFFLVRPGEVTHTHNLYIQVLVDVGVPGLIAWLAILSVVLFITLKLFQRGKRNSDQFLIGLGMGFFCSQLALLVHGFTDSISWTVARPAPIVWGIWGVVVSAYILSEKNKRS